MDPVAVKFVQLIIAEIAGVALAVFGVILFLRGVSGRANLILQGAGWTAKLTNSAPGGIITLLGVALISMSLNSTVERHEWKPGASVATTVDQWLARSSSVSQGMDLSAVEDAIVGKDPNARFVSKLIKIDTSASLGDIATKQYGDTKYWHLIAAINKDRGYFTLKTATATFAVNPNSYLEMWYPSKYDELDIDTRIKVYGRDRTAAYDELLNDAQRGVDFGSSFDSLSNSFKQKEVPLVLTELNSSGVTSMREASIKYYGEAKYWPIIVWSNKKAFSNTVREGDPLPKAEMLLIPVIVGPR